VTIDDDKLYRWNGSAYVEVSASASSAAAPETFTNKTIADYTNHVHADILHFRVKATEVIAK